MTKRIIVVGFGMVGIAFIEKLLNYDEDAKDWSILVLGEEPHLAYNRVELTNYFTHRSIPKLYLQPAEWYVSQQEKGALSYRLSVRVSFVDHNRKCVVSEEGETFEYDALVLAVGSTAQLPAQLPGIKSQGIFVYRNIDDLERLLKYSAPSPLIGSKSAAIIGGGLIGLEAAKAIIDTKIFAKVKLIVRSKYLMSRQIDEVAGAMLVTEVRKLGIQVILDAKVQSLDSNEGGELTSITFEDGSCTQISLACFAVGVKPRDEIAHNSQIECHNRGGIIVDDKLQTSKPDVYAIGECVNHHGESYGLIGPGIEMAEVLAYNLTHSHHHMLQKSDVSVKLKLLGVNVASFGENFADRVEGEKTQCVTYSDPFQSIYKKYIFSDDGKYLLGGMIIGESSDYPKVHGLAKVRRELDVAPGSLIMGNQKPDSGDDADDLQDSDQICSCYNVSKGALVKVIRDGTCSTLDECKSKTKAGTGCGGCIPLVKSILKKELMALGKDTSSHICPHFKYTRSNLYHIIKIKKLKVFSDVMEGVGTTGQILGCDICKPIIASIFSSLWNPHVMAKEVHGLQDTNDRFMANIQRDGTFSVVPRIPGGEITPDRLIAIGQVAKEFKLYCKITGGQRIDLFGCPKHNLPNVWRRLIDAGMESGHAYGKALRTVKSCVGSSWCRFGVQDSTALAIEIEERYKSIRSPHKIKGAVSGCVRECAEAQNKDFGLVATVAGYNVYVGGNGGAKPRHSDLLVASLPIQDVIPVLDRYIMFYVSTAEPLQRTARWIENLPGGITYLKEVVLEDKLKINADLEQQMSELVGTFSDEWAAVLNDQERLKKFAQFANITENEHNFKTVLERDQYRPAKPSSRVKARRFSDIKWSKFEWKPVIKISEFGSNEINNGKVQGGSVAVKVGDTQLAIFLIPDLGYIATQQMSPDRFAFTLSDGIIGSYESGIGISCPIGKKTFSIANSDKLGECTTDETISIAVFDAKQMGDWVHIYLPPAAELDGILGTSQWMMQEDGSQKGTTAEKLDW